MGENLENQLEDTNNYEITFYNLTILKEFSNIVNLVRNEDFLEAVPKTKLRRVNWVSMFNCLKQGILDEMVQELNVMWEFENMPEKLEVLDKQKEKFADVNHANWRPQHNNVKAQLKASDAANLKKQKILLESLAKEYETKVNGLKNKLTAKRAYFKAMHMDILKYQKKNDNLISKIHEKLNNHNNLVNIITTKPRDIDDWPQKGLEIED